MAIKMALEGSTSHRTQLHRIGHKSSDEVDNGVVYCHIVWSEQRLSVVRILSELAA